MKSKIYILQDTDTYIIVNKNPVTKLSNGREILSRWKNSGFITASTYRSLYCSDGFLPRAYGLPKIHKLNCPFRIIVSSVNSPLHHLATYLHNYE